MILTLNTGILIVLASRLFAPSAVHVVCVRVCACHVWMVACAVQCVQLQPAWPLGFNCERCEPPCHIMSMRVARQGATSTLNCRESSNFQLFKEEGLEISLHSPSAKKKFQGKSPPPPLPHGTPRRCNYAVRIPSHTLGHVPRHHGRGQQRRPAHKEEGSDV